MTLGDLYNKYRRENKDTPFHLEASEFKKAAKMVFQGIVDELLTGKTYKLPYNMGDLYVDKFKGKSNTVDFGATKKYGKTIYHQNFHSDGFIYKLKWRKAHSRFQNRKMYNFKLIRKHSRNLSSLIKQNKIKIFKHYG